jgi:ribonuclease P protein component
VFLEADVSASQHPAPENARIPRPDEERRRPQSAEPKASEGSASLDRLVRPSPDAHLRFRNDFQILYAHGTAVRGDLMVMIFRPNELGLTRLGFVASGKVGTAVTRNRSKRLLREAFRALRGNVDLGALKSTMSWGSLSVCLNS